KSRAVILKALADLPQARVATDHEVLEFIDSQSLAGSGLGYVDVHLLAAARLTDDASLWTRDRRLHGAANRLRLSPHSNPKRAARCRPERETVCGADDVALSFVGPSRGTASGARSERTTARMVGTGSRAADRRRPAPVAARGQRLRHGLLRRGRAQHDAKRLAVLLQFLRPGGPHLAPPAARPPLDPHAPRPPP